MLKRNLPEELRTIKTIALYTMGEKVEGAEDIDHPAVLVLRGNELYREGKYREAYEAYSRAYQGNKDLVEAKVNMGFALIRMGKDEEAKEIFESLPDEYKNEYVYNELGNIYARMGDVERAQDYYNRALEISPNFELAKLNLAVMNLMKGNPEDAQEILQSLDVFDEDIKAHALKIEALVKYYRGDIEGAYHSINLYLQFKPDDHVAWLLKAECEGAMGKFEDAEKSARKSYEIKPTISAEIAIAAFKLENGEVSDAIKMAENVLSKKVTNYRLNRILAIGYFRNGVYSSAYSHAKEYLEYRDSDYILLILGESSRRIGKYEEALEAANRILDRHPDNRSAKILKALALSSLGRGEEAIAILDSIEEEDYILHSAFAEVYLAMGDKRNASVHMEKALDERMDINMIRKLCLILYDIGELTRMERWINKLVETESKDAFVWFLKGEIIFDKNIDEAEGYYKMAIDLDADFKEAHMKLAMIYAIKGDVLSLENHLKRAKALGGTPDMWRTVFQTLYDNGFHEIILKYIEGAVESTQDPTLRIYQVKALVSLERYDEAEGVLDDLLKSVPGMKEALLYRGIVKYHLKQYKEAARIFESLVNDYELDSNYYLARISFETGKTQSALDIVDRYDYDPRFILLKMEILNSLQKYEELVNYISTKISNLEGRDLTRALVFKMESLFSLGRNEEAYSVGEEILERNPEQVDIMLKLAMHYYDDGLFEDAERYAKKALEVEESETALLIHAKSAYSFGKYDLAFESLSKIAGWEEREETLILAAKIMYEKGEFESAIKYAEGAISVSRDNLEALAILGKANYALSRYDEAIKHMEKLFLKDVKNMDALYYLPMSYYRIKRYENAEKMFERAYEKKMENLFNVEYTAAYADTLINLGKYDIALKVLTKYGDDSDLINLLKGKALFHMQELGSAREHIEKVSDESLFGEKIYYLTQIMIARKEYEAVEKLLQGIEREEGDILYYHALALFNLGRYEEALQKFMKYRESGGQRDDLSYHIGICLFNLEKYEESITYLKEAEKYSDDAFLYEARAHYKLQHYDEAANLFKICEKKEILDGESYYLYGDSLEKTGENGLEMYEKAWKYGYRNSLLAYRLMKEYYEGGDIERAMEFTEHSLDYGNEARILAAKIYFELGELDNVLISLNEVDTYEAAIIKARALATLGRADEAIEILMKYSELPEVSFELTKLLVEAERYEEADKYIKVGEKHGDLTYEKMIVSYHMGRWEEAIANADTLLGRGEWVKEANYVMGVSLYNIGRYEEAIEYLSRSIDLGVETKYYLGMCYYEIGNYKDAIMYLSEVPNGRYYLARSLFNVGNYREALSIFEELDTPDSKEMAGLCAYKLGDYERAIDYLSNTNKFIRELAESYFMLEMYDKVIEVNPDDPRLLGMAHYHLGHLKEAIEYLESLESKSPEDYYSLAMAYLRIEDYEKAEEYLERARSAGYEGDTSEFEGIIAYNKGEYEVAANMLKNSKDPNNRRLYAFSLFKIGKLKEAEMILSEFDDDESRHLLAQTLMAMGGKPRLRRAMDIFLDLGDSVNAAACAIGLGDYERVISLLKGREDSESLDMLFTSYYNLKRYDDAVVIYWKLPESSKATHAKEMALILMEIKNYEDARKIIDAYFFEDYEWFMIKAKFAIATGDHEGAVEALTQAKKINPHDPEISRMLAPLLINKGEVKAALKEAKKSVKDFPEDAVCWYNLGLAYHKSGKEERAIEALRKSVELNPELKDAWHLLGMIYVGMGRYEDAYAALSKTKEMVQDRDILFTLAMTAYELERYEEALEYIERAIKMRRDYMGLYYKALILIELEREEEAMGILKEIISMKPDFVEARKLLGSLMGGE